MNAEAYAKMRETHIAPCGCEVMFEVWDGVEHQHVHHECMPNRKHESDVANAKSELERAERQERKMLMSQIPLSVLRDMVRGRPRTRA